MMELDGRGRELYSLKEAETQKGWILFQYFVDIEDDCIKASKDEEYRKKLMKKFGTYRKKLMDELGIK